MHPRETGRTTGSLVISGERKGKRAWSTAADPSGRAGPKHRSTPPVGQGPAQPGVKTPARVNVAGAALEAQRGEERKRQLPPPYEVTKGRKRRLSPPKHVPRAVARIPKIREANHNPPPERPGFEGRQRNRRRGPPTGRAIGGLDEWEPDSNAPRQLKQHDWE